ncbi:cysteine desulfurase [bacterium]|nr:cysteine desulfurase [bacterium]
MSPLNYFDHNATAPMSQVAKEAWLNAAEQFPGNPSSLHRVGMRADKALEDARQTLATYLGCSPLDIVWTSSATESNNMAWYHLGQTIPKDGEVWVSSIEHPCCIESVKRWFGDRIKWIPSNMDGVIDLDWLASQAKKVRPHLVCLMAANNETGCLQPWESVKKWCEERGIAFFCDASQWLGRLPSKGLGACDWISACAHKFGGPKGVGFLKCPSKGRLEPLILGGPQEMNRRAGTENVPGILSMVIALDACEKQLNKDSIDQKVAIQQEFELLLQKELPAIRVLGHGVDRLWNTSSVIMPEVDCRVRWVVKLDKMGFAVSTGSACASGKEKTSHVLKSIGMESAEASRVLRFSSGWDTTLDSWKELVSALQKVYAEIRQR